MVLHLKHPKSYQYDRAVRKSVRTDQLADKWKEVTLMTQNQIAWYNAQRNAEHNTDSRAIEREKLGETTRANKAREAETYRSNRASEIETHRSNTSNEALKHESNVITLTKNFNDNIEAQRHNRATEAQAANQLELDAITAQAKNQVDTFNANTDRLRYQLNADNSYFDNQLKVSQIGSNQANKLLAEQRAKNETVNTGNNIISSVFKTTKGLSYNE